jgi:hypothetical protein
MKACRRCGLALPDDAHPRTQYHPECKRIAANDRRNATRQAVPECANRCGRRGVEAWDGYLFDKILRDGRTRRRRRERYGQVWFCASYDCRVAWYEQAANDHADWKERQQRKPEIYAARQKQAKKRAKEDQQSNA